MIIHKKSGKIFAEFCNNQTTFIEGEDFNYFNLAML